MDTQMKKGVLEMCILLSLKKHDLYGYEIMKLIKEVFPNVYDGSIYTILRRLKDGGYTYTYMQDVPSGGPTRKYYRITEEGLRYAEDMYKDWKNMTNMVDIFITHQ